MNARENFHAMMSGGKPAWLPLNVPVTPPVADLIEEKTGVRSPELSFETDFGFDWVGYDENPQQWRDALAAIGPTPEAVLAATLMAVKAAEIFGGASALAAGQVSAERGAGLSVAITLTFPGTVYLGSEEQAREILTPAIVEALLQASGRQLQIDRQLRGKGTR